MKIATELYVIVAIGSMLITGAGIRAVVGGEQFNLFLAFVLLGIVASVGFWLMAIDVSRTE